jgi:hypothetical protein
MTHSENVLLDAPTSNLRMQKMLFSFCGLCKVCRSDSEAANAFKSGIRSGVANQVG